MVMRSWHETHSMIGMQNAIRYFMTGYKDGAEIMLIFDNGQDIAWSYPNSAFARYINLNYSNFIPYSDKGVAKIKIHRKSTKPFNILWS